MRRTLLHAVLLAMTGAACSSNAADVGSTTTLPGSAPAAGSGAPVAVASAMPTVVPAAPKADAPAVRAAPSAAAPAAMGAPATASVPAAASGGVMAVPTGELPKATGGAISDACRGFDFNGITHSPGGDVTPNKCEAFHPTLNNPYAVRCVDVWPWYKTKYPGDNFCILPPPPDKGVQIGHHPQGEGDAWFQAVSKGDMSGYENVPADWKLTSGGEEERNINVSHSNAAGKYYRLYTRMRGGSHHMINSTTTGVETGKWGPGGADGLWSSTNFPGAQRPDENTPHAVNIPEEDRGLYREFPANATVTYNMHHFNSTDGDILKEAWQNIWWTDDAKTKMNVLNGLPAQQAITPFANPGEIVDMHYAATMPGSVRLLSLLGHRHAWTTAFTVWVESSGKEPNIVYQSMDWFDEPTYTYNSEVKNPMPAPDKKADGGHSGVLMLSAGDQLHFNCHIEYTDERAKSERSPVTPAENGPLRFANQAYHAEMCILFGSTVGDIGLLEQLGAPPDFAKAR